MKKSMCITYEVGDGLYVNITNRCSNRCDFCIRNNGEGAYGSDCLWLEREPSAEEIIASVFSRDISSYSEIVFCGYGEPTYRLCELISVASAIKDRYPNMPIRINTNGQASLIHMKDTAPLFSGVIDTVSVSLNAADAASYDKICHSKFGESAFDAIIEFTKKVKNYVQKVSFSVVGDFLSPEEIDRCREIAKDCGVSIRVRDYISE